ncbi:MAG: helix-turn-helix domain-containing protein [Actinomycetota bacterium]|jgi:DNA-binding CsgD family transcriptional regulator
MEFISLGIFIFSAAMAAGSILLVTRLLEEYPLPCFRSLFYHNLFISAFGFYGIWGQFIIVALAGSRLDPALYSTVSVISLLLGLPFLVFGWLMLIRFAAEASGIRLGRFFTPLFLIVNFGIIAAIGLALREMEFNDALPLFRYYYVAAALLYALIASFVMLKGDSSSPGTGDRFILALMVSGGAAAQALALVLIPHSAWMALVFVFLLFAAITFLSLYLSYKADLKPVRLPEPMPLPGGIEDFMRRNEISPREAEIIREICNGLSNQEIADKLFISLQTVKDHTSRIYVKANVRNRMQLMALVRGMDAGTVAGEHI